MRFAAFFTENQYYGSQNWFEDKGAFEKGKIPHVKAGVLSEDAVWNLNEEIRDVIKDMRKILEKEEKGK